MESAFARSEMLIGRRAIEKLQGSHVAVFGLGGVGGAVVESLARAGVGALDVIDKDTIDITNLNRQILATYETVGQLKTDAAERRIHQINPACKVTRLHLFYLPETADTINLSQYDYVVDAIDNVTAKLHLAERCHELGVPLIAAMGAGNRLNALGFTVADIYETEGDKLAKVMRRELRKRGIPSLKVVYSPAPTVIPTILNEQGEPCRPPCPGSTPFVPPICGLMLAAEVTADLIRDTEHVATLSNVSVQAQA